MVAFWGCEVTETKAAVVDVPSGFVLNVCNATFGASNADVQVALGLETQQLDGKVWKGTVAHLNGQQALQVKLDLVFGHKVKFYLAKGSGAVNLTGYFQPGPSADMLDDVEASTVLAVSTKKNKKRARDEKKASEKSWDEISPSSSDSENVPVKTSNAATTLVQKKEPKKKEKATDALTATTSNSTTPSGTLQKKRKKKRRKQTGTSDAK